MINESILNQLPTEAKIVRKAPLAGYTTFQLGGACPVLIDCPTATALAETAKLLMDHHIEYMVIGQGSNLLVADAGIHCVMLRFCAEEQPEVLFSAEGIRVSGGTLLDDLSRLAIEKGVGDLSFCSGIPGTVGGAIVGNAGAFGRQIGDLVESLEVLDCDGTIRWVTADEVEFEYRSSGLKQSGGVVLNARLNVEVCEIETMKAERERIMELRRSKHPDWRSMPCAGSVFRNIEPTSAAGRRQAAGWFLEEAGAKDFRVGQAHLFEKHANIIIADPGATARDVFILTERMIAAVQEKFNFTLEREIKLVGDF